MDGRRHTRRVRSRRTGFGAELVAVVLVATALISGSGTGALATGTPGATPQGPTPQGPTPQGPTPQVPTPQVPTGAAEVAEAVAGAGPASFAYDATGRLAGMSTPGGAIARWTYDAAGNITGVTRPGATPVAILAVVPSTARRGESIRITGTGFSATPAANSVTVNGVAATVTKASATELTATLPATATSGTVGVTVAGATGTFPGLVVDTRAAASITGLTPDVVAAGAAVTLTATGLDAEAANNVLLLNAMAPQVTARGASSLTFAVPAGTGGGPVTVATPIGVGRSPDLFVVPAGTAVADVSSTGRIPVGTRTVLTVPAGKTALRLFDGADADRFAVVLDAGTGTGCALALTLWDRTLTSLAANSCIGAGAFLDASPAVKEGTNTLTLRNPGTAAASIGVTVARVADLDFGALPLDGTSTTATTTVAGQNGAFRLTGTAGQRVAVATSANTYPGGCCGVYWYLYAPDGTRVGYSYGNNLLDTVTLPVAGDYRLFVDPQGTNTGALTFTGYTVPADRSVPLPLNGTAKTVTISSIGQNANLTFTGTAGQRIAVQTSANTFPGGCCGVYWYLYAPDGTRVGYSYGNNFLDTVTLPVAGAYRIFVDPQGVNTGALTFTARKVPADLATTLPLTGTAKTVTIPNIGQNANLTFTGTAVQRVAVQGSANTFPGGCCGVYWYLYAPDGTRVDYSYGDTFLDTVTLPATGTYRLFLDPQGVNTGALTLTAWRVPADLSIPLPLDGTATTVAITNPGQNANLTFTATAGARVAVQGSAQTFGTSCCDVYWYLYAPDGTRVDYSYGNTFLDTVTLPATGTYRLFVDPQDARTGAITINGYAVPADVVGTLPLDGTARPVTILGVGQNANLTFTPTTGQRVTLTGSGSSYPGCCGVYWYVYDPNGARVNYYWGNNTLSFVASVAGTYRLFVDPRDANTGTIAFTATQAAPGPTPATVRPADPRAGAKLPPPSTSRRPAPLQGGGARTSAAGRAGEVTPADVGPAAQAAQAAQRATAAWRPDAGNTAGIDWVTRRGPAAAETTALLGAGRGVTAVAGRVLTLDGAGLRGVTVRTPTSTASTTTDATGRFVLPVPDGTASVVVDGRTANAGGAGYGVFRIRVRPQAGRTVGLDATVWMPRLDTRHAVTLTVPTTRQTVLTTPDIPGLEVRIPAGSVVRDVDGAVVTKLGITAVPLDRPPFPLPRNGIVPVYFTVQPGGGSIFPTGAQVVYPNYTKLPAGSEVDFWNYDPAEKGWYVYGHGTVSRDGRQVVPDADTRLWTLDGSMFNTPGNPKPDQSWWDDFVDWLSGDPVELSSGLMTDRVTDLAVADTMPISLTRSYWQGDGKARDFGLNQSSDHNMFLVSELQYQEVDLYLPGGAKVHYVRTSPGTGYSDAVFTATATGGQYLGTTIAFGGGGWNLVLRDGTHWYFPMYARPAWVQDRAGNRTTFTRIGGNNGEVSRITSPNGRWIALEYDGSNRVVRATDNIGRAVSYTYDTAGRLATVTDVAGSVRTYAYDPSNRITSITDARGVVYLRVTYDANGRVAQQTLAGTGTYAFAYTLDAGGKVTATRVTQPNGSVRRVTFDPTGIVLTDTAAFGTALARTTTYERAPNRQVTAVVDPYGRRTAIAYDGQNRPTSVTVLAGTAEASVVETTTYGAFDLPLSTRDALGRTTRYAYDASGNLTSITDPAGRTTRLTYRPDGQVATLTDASGGRTTYTYVAGALAQTSDPLGRVARQFVDAVGRVAQVTDAAGVRTDYRYDAQNQLVRVTASGVTQAFTYDPNGNLATATDGRGNVARWAYDTSNRVTTATDALGAVRTYAYDAAGRVTAATDRRGLRTTFAYDALDRATRVAYGVSGAAEQSALTYAYDATDRLASVTDTAGGTTTLGYDARDRVTTRSGPTGTTTYTYDAAGQVLSSTAGGEAATTYAYDAAGLVTGVAQGAVAATYTYDAGGRLTRIALPGSWSQSYAYDAAGQVTRITYAHAGTTAGTQTYGYDPVGRRSAVGGTLANVRLPAARSALAYDAANRLTSAGGVSLTYDADGNLTGDGARTYTWDARGQLAGIAGAVTASFSYDAFGERTARTVAGAGRRFLAAGGNVATEQSPAGATTARLLSGGVDQWLARTSGTLTQAVLTDVLGSPVAAGAGDGTLAAEYAYDPYGVATTTGALDGSDLTFTGRQDDGTGLMYYRSRYYSPTLGRFVSQDPLGQAGGINLYEYALGAPTVYTDPNGTNPIAGCLAGAAIGGLGSYASQRLAGQKVDWGDVGMWAAGGCAVGAGAGAAWRAWSAARAGAPSLFGNLTHAGRGIQSYSAQAQFTAGQRGAVQAHHLIEQRFANVIGGNTNSWPTVVVTRAEHQVFTNAWRQAIPYGANGTGMATRSSVEAAARQIYARYPEILAALGL